MTTEPSQEPLDEDTAGEGPVDERPVDEEPVDEEPVDGEPADEVARRLAGIEERLAEFHRRAAHREAVIDRLHEENQVLRRGAARAVLEPVVADLVRLYDQLDREAGRLGGADAGPMIGSFAEDTAQILDRCGLEIFTASPGDTYDPARHRPLGVAPCTDEALHNTVAEVMAAGFVERETGKVRRPVQARFHRYSPSPDAER